MSDYESLAVLRRALTDDDPDRRANAYGDIMTHDVEPSAILSSPPDEDAVGVLRSADVLPEQAQSGVTAAEFQTRALELLEAIEANTAGGGA